MALIIPTALSLSDFAPETVVALFTASIPLVFSALTCPFNFSLSTGSKSAFSISEILSRTAFSIASTPSFLASAKSFSAFARLPASKLMALIIPTALSLSDFAPETVVALFTASIPLVFSALTCPFNFSLSEGNRSAFSISEILSRTAFSIASIPSFLASDKSFSALAFLNEPRSISLIVFTTKSRFLLISGISVNLLIYVIPLSLSVLTRVFNTSLSAGKISAFSISANFSVAPFLMTLIASFLLVLTAFSLSTFILFLISASKPIPLIIPIALSRSELTPTTFIALPTASIPLFFSAST